MFCVLESSVVKHHTDNALKFRGIHLEILLAGACATFMNANVNRMRRSYLHHFTSDFRNFPNFPIVEHSNFIGLTCNRKILRQCSSLLQRTSFQHVCSGVCGFYEVMIYEELLLSKQQIQTCYVRIQTRLETWTQTRAGGIKMDHLPIIPIFSFGSLFANIKALLNTLMLTLVEVGERFIMQFNSRRGRCTQNILKGKDHILIFWRQAGLLLLEDGKRKNITGGKKTDTYITCTAINTVNPDYPTQTFTFYNALPSNSW